MADTQQVESQDPTAEELWAQEAAQRAATEPDYSIAPAAPAAVAAAPEPKEPEVDPDVKALLEKVGGLEDLIGKLTHEVSSSSGRVAAIQREMAASKVVAQVVPHAPNQQAVNAASKSLEKWDQLKNDFPDWAAAIEERVGIQAPVQAAAVDLKPLQDQLMAEVGAVRAAVTLGLEEAKIYGAHRNWKAEAASPEFKAWFATLPAETKALADSVKADDVIKVLDDWSTHKNDSARNVRAERKNVLAAAASAPRRSTAAMAPVTDDQKSPNQIWEEEKQQRLAARARQR